jgi:3-hydroxyacyl-[acyl-carrier-protein] dehydratase
MPTVEIEQIRRILPHRYPFLMVDRVLDYRPGESLTALKNITANEAYFQGHFPARPVMPGVLIVEAMAQAAGILAFYSENAKENAISYLAGIDKARFKRPVVPGDQLIIDVSAEKGVMGIFRFRASAKVDGKLVARCELLSANADK